ncbi:Ig-like domain-containing protein [Ruminococcus bovis]|uniref:Fibronectin type-III domain-containing protein n=1 Tax=Ruminococcus bovis TaxID=2564099 RepID=A0A4P8XVU0_9FIRM|nr:Ig-like domain-containing protein [Ruminococcus bovis]QCT07226.1 hypothetical protein E5Z56_07580 [Ruminococcus bovis]
MKFKKLSAILVAFLVAVTSTVLPLSDTFSNVLKTTNSAKALAKSSAVKMPDNAIEFKSMNDRFEVIPSYEKGGFYYFNKSINFYDVKNNTVREIADYSYKDIVDSFVSESKIYLIIEEDKYTSNPKYYIDVFNSLTEKVELSKNLSDVFPNINSFSADAIGVDNQGRYYIAISDNSGYDTKYSIHLFSKNFEEITSVDTKGAVYDFCGFDSTNGNFYFEGDADWVYWGYTHTTNALKCGNVADDKVTVNDGYIDVFYRQYNSYHKRNAIMLSNGNLAWSSILFSKVGVMNSKNLNTDDISDLPMLGSVSRDGYEGNDRSYGSVGPGIVHNNVNDTTVMYANNNKLVEYDNDFNRVSSYDTKFPVFSLFNYGNNIMTIEKDTDGNYYVDNIYWSKPSKIELSQNSATINVGDSVALTTTSDTVLKYFCDWSSSDNSVASVTSDGKVYGNREGTVVITAKTDDNTKVQCTVTVKGKSQPLSGKNSLDGTSNENISQNNYSTWASVVNSYLSENEDGTLNKVENTSDGVLIEKYSSDGKKLISSNKVEKELNKFGGYFYGKDNNYLVFGEDNKEEKDSAEIMRVVKYTKDWTKVSDCKICGSNTYEPFNAGSLRMAELDGKLYVYTCHTMYTTEDKLNHQANMIFTIDESTMKTIDYQYVISNLTQGYVSHSFNQFIKTYGDYIYRVDHSETGDLVEGGEIMAVNGITLTKFNKNDQSTEVTVTVPEKFNIRRGNYTGSSIGGFEIGSDNCIIAFSQDISKTNRKRNVYLTVTDTSFYKTKKVPLTNYTDNDNITCGTPELVKISENLFLIMWEETNASTSEVVTKGMTVDAKGQTVSSAKTLTARLSDCQPILCSDNLVKWYVTDNNGTTLYSLNPYYIENLHEHKYTSKVTKEPTCKETGIRTYTCECGDTYTESIATIDHKYQYKLVKQSTCTEEGIGKYTCTECGDTYTETLPKIGHDYEQKVVKPTCTEQGYTLNVCKNCGDTYKSDFVDKIDHNYKYEIVKEPTCTEEGIGKYTCTVCGDTYTETLPKIGHDYEQKVVKPTCTEQGYTLNVCKNCGDTYKSDFVDKTDHNYKYEIVKEPTCTEEGIGKYTCTECGDNYTETISKTNHDYEQKVVKPTCTEQGYTLNVCKNCGDTYKSDFVDKIDHNYKYEVVKEPTCTEEGLGKYICTECGETLIDTIPTIDHSFVTTTTPATMKSNGRIISKCSICNNVQYDNVINKISSVSISKTTFTYNSKTQTPTVTVKDSKNKILKNKTNYTVTYSRGRKNVGRYSVKVKFKGNYSGGKTFYYNIVPKATSVKSVKGLSKGMQVNLKLQKTQTTGYQIQYSTFKNFKNAKTVTVKNTVSAKKITKLKAKKKYFVRVRTYKTTKFSGKNYNLYSLWSSAKTTVTK